MHRYVVGIFSVSIIAQTLVCGTITAVDEIIKDTFPINAIRSVTYTLEGVSLVTQIELDRPNLMGAKESHEDIIFRNLVVNEAAEMKLTPDDEAVDRYLANIQETHNITMQELEDMFIAAGRTPEEGRKDLRDMQTMNMMFEFRILSNLLVSQKEIEAYYNENPEWVDGAYQLLYGTIPYSKEAKEVQRVELMKKIEAGDDNNIAWGKPFWVNHADVDPEKEFIFSMKPGEISLPYDNGSGFECYKLLESKQRHLKSLESRLAEITNILKRPRYIKLLDTYKKELFNNASILYLS